MSNADEIEELKSGAMKKDGIETIVRVSHPPGRELIRSDKKIDHQRSSALHKRNGSSTYSQVRLSHRDDKACDVDDLCGDKDVRAEQRHSQKGRFRKKDGKGQPRCDHDACIGGQLSHSQDYAGYPKADDLCRANEKYHDVRQSHCQGNQLICSDMKFHGKEEMHHVTRDDCDTRSEGRMSHRDDRRCNDDDFYGYYKKVGDNRPKQRNIKHHIGNSIRFARMKPSNPRIWLSLKSISVLWATFLAFVFAMGSVLYFHLIVLNQTPSVHLAEGLGAGGRFGAHKPNRLGVFKKVIEIYESEIPKLLGGSRAYEQKNRMWAVKAALDRLDKEIANFKQKDDKKLEPPGSHRSKRIGFFLQLGTNFDILPDMTMCLANVATATLSEGEDEDLSLDLHVAVKDNHKRKGHLVNQFFFKMLSLWNSHSSVFTIAMPNAGADTKTFISQIRFAEQRGMHYDFFLKIGAESDPVLRERMLESLCGTPEQVLSVLAAMARLKHQPTLLAPHGTIFGPSTPVDEMLPYISNQSKNEIFNVPNVREINKLKQKLDGTRDDFTEDEMSIVAGSSFWVNRAGLVPKFWAKSDSVLKDASLTNSIDAVIPSLILTLEDSQLLDIQPAPRIMAIYFPQYHPIPENDRFWGENFTEWTFLRDMKVPDDQPPLKKPLRLEEGGLGYYNLEDYSTRQRQADLAHEYGVQGFVFYHYWFSGDKAPKNHLVMGKIAEAMLRDGQPNVNFMLSWANEPWTKRWDGGNEEVLLSQTYGDEDDWLEHYQYLLPFFKHEKYVRVEGAPVFVIYRPENILDKVLRPMVDFWQRLSKERGDFANGLHIVRTISALTKASEDENSVFNASFQFWPSYKNIWPSYKKAVARGHALTSSQEDFPIDAYPNRHMQYWGGFVGFDRRPRDPSDLRSALPSPEKFRQGLCETSFPRLASYRNRNIATNLFFITAWNEWNEQAVLEPNAIDRFGYLQSLHYCLKNIPALPVKANNDKIMRYEFCSRCHGEWGQCGRRIKYLEHKYGTPPEMGKLGLMKEGKCLQEVLEGAIGGTYVIRNGTKLVPAASLGTRQENEVPAQ